MHGRCVSIFRLNPCFCTHYSLVGGFDFAAWNFALFYGLRDDGNGFSW